MSILIADSNALRRRGIRRLLDGDDLPRLIDVERRAAAINEAIRKHAPQVVVIGTGVDDQNGEADLVAEIARDHGPVVVVISRQGDFEHVRAALRAGALGFVLGADVLAELGNAVRAAMDGQRYLSPALGATLLADDRAEDGEQLNERETEVLRLLALGHTNAQVAAQLYLSVRTIENHRANLLRKLDAVNRVDLVHAALERGLLSEPARPDTQAIIA